MRLIEKICEDSLESYLSFTSVANFFIFFLKNHYLSTSDTTLLLLFLTFFSNVFRVFH